MKASWRIGVVAVVAVALGVPLAMSARQTFSPLIVFGHSIGGIRIGDKWSSILATYGRPDVVKINAIDAKGTPYQPLQINKYNIVGGGGLFILVHHGRVVIIETTSRHFHTLEQGHVGLYIGKRVQDYPCDTSLPRGTVLNRGHCERSLTPFHWHQNCYSFVKHTGPVDTIIELSEPTALNELSNESRYPILWFIIGPPFYTKALGCHN